MTNHNSARTIVLIGLMTTVIAGCTPPETGDRYVGLTAMASPQSQEILRRHSVYFATDSSRLSDSEREALAIFLRTSASSPNARIRVLGHADERASDTYNLALSARRSDAVADYLQSIAQNSTTVERSYFGERAPAALGSNQASWQKNRRVEVVVQDYAVQVPSCPEFNVQTGTNMRNATLDGLGCANATNLARMVANPADLAPDRPVLPSDIGAGDAPQTVLAIERYRTGKVIELKDGGVSQ
ncbi:MAG: OmpA family protein [Geminicoccaceae bacterium]|nr:OmpA family protein [Geminicoccaceae bacterium]